ncbi:CoA transferase [Leeia sp. TBRC 13508]|uniref:CoA transferase n=1 Tax=Leeia speluncae TaxID=2884804 RepID=A0ABS8D7I2_9NEIS|nr:CaiB/BaiF CoA-transferase family protein [Leeia speluncae]MCB6184164.1 CoA transferase [Leeia speluncae]
MGALSHLRVLDLSRVLAGPWCSQNLADLGAHVIKVERTLNGDDTRGWGPPFLKDTNGNDTKEAAYYLCANRGKQSVTIDFTRPEGQALLHELVKQCDVVLENFKVGGLKKYQLDYDSIKAIKPDIVYCSITGFGQSGPYAERAGYDFMIQGLGGLMSITGDPDGEPQKVGVAVTDLFTGMYATTAILAALNHRQVTGVGQHIDIALLDCQLAMLANVASNHLVGGMKPPRLGNAHANIVPYQVFEVADGHIIVAVGNDTQFARFAALCGHAEWANDERFAANKNRVKNRQILVPMIAEAMKLRNRDEWLQMLEVETIPCGPINSIPQAFEDPHVQYRQIKVNVPHPSAGNVPLVANPIRLSETPIEYNVAPPTLGQHTQEVLSDIAGLTEEQLAELAGKGVI